MNQTQSTHPSGGSTQSPEAKRAGFVSALQICEAVACGYSEGAGFIVLTELPSPRLPAPPVAPHPPLRRRPWALARRLLGRDPGVAPPTVVSNKLQRPSAHCDVGAAATPRWRRRGVQWAQRPCTRLCRFVPTPARPVTSPYQQQQRHAATASSATEDSSRRPRRALPRAGDGCCRLVVSAHRPEAIRGARETAQALQHGCGDDCSRSASLAALHARPRALH